MTAVADQDHTDHTDHMGRCDAEDGKGGARPVCPLDDGSGDGPVSVTGTVVQTEAETEAEPEAETEVVDGIGGDGRAEDGGGGGTGGDTDRERPASVTGESEDTEREDREDRGKSAQAGQRVQRGQSTQGVDGAQGAADGLLTRSADLCGAAEGPARERQAWVRAGYADRDRAAYGEPPDVGANAYPAENSGRDTGSRLQPPHARLAEEAPHQCPPRETPASHPAADATPDADHDSSEAWDDGLIARRVTEATVAALAVERASAFEAPGRDPGSPPAPLAYDGPLRSRLDALRELVGLSRTRLDSRTLAGAGRVLDEAAARRRLSGRHTVVAIAGATGSGKSQLFNTLAGVAISETGVRRPTTAAPIACSWSDGAAGLIDRLGIPGRQRRRPLQSPEAEAQLRGLVLVDLPDHDSAAVQHREQVDRILKLVDAVIWVVDPEKYADAVLHERYLRPMAGHAEVMFVVLNQVDRLPGEAADQVLDDLRRLLDEDGIALGEYGEPGATVLALSALTGQGIGELREALGQFVAERGAPARRVAADMDAAAAELRPVYANGRRTGLSEQAREEFATRLAESVGATAAGEAAERAWLRNANRACGTPWLRLWRWYQDRGEPHTGRLPVRAQADEEATARQRVEQAVRTVSERASAGLPAPWAQAVREAAARGSQGLSEALDALAERSGLPSGRLPRPGWWPAAVLVQASMTLLQVVGGLWLVGQIVGVMAPNLGVPVLLMLCGIVGGPLVEWGCRMAARGPARRYGQDAERQLREAAANCGRARVLDPVAAELLRYQEVREQYGRVVRTGAGAGAGVGAGVG
ncbi:YfjP family GTPase [Streptomyces pluripotens]|uniref:YfjP family GTPase n=1 Tax=Streptomyces pluripotens TaxID=1355015 RepID=UPI000A292E60|nr:YfjP family GTPase [Streptomyces pluripotens]ARP70273.1 ATP-binding protein [Streptomyces pluripotens]